VREVLPDETPSGVQAFFLNTRRAKFGDRRVRAALGLAFDFGWTNKNIFHGLYKRTTSMFENSELAAKAPPSPAERALLEPFRGQVPDQVFERPFAPPETDGSGNIRRHLRTALKLLAAAGWTVQDGELRDDAGAPMTVEFLMFEPTFQRVIAPYIRNLERLGIEARMRIVDLANFEYRMEHFDYDVIVRRYVQPLTPGIEQRGLWTSAYADVVGSRNISGIKNPVIDALVETVIAAKSRTELTTAARALDRVLMWNQYVVPHWYKGSHTIAYWHKFSRPAIKPRYARGVIDTWWVDPDKERLLAAGRPPPKG
jgi:microcin C transport system substrate-binding protein